jgi:predicted dehydrogenase
MERVRFGVAGVGGMGAGHCNYLSERVPEATLAAVYDVNGERAAQLGEQYSVHAYHDLSRFLRSGLFDAVVIATPHYFHPEIAIEAFRQGLHVLTEKPLSVTVSQADAMIAAARASGKRFGIVYQMRTEPEYRAAKRLVEQGIIGEIYRTMLITGWYRTQAYYDSGGWRATWAGEGGGVLINQAPHYIDLFTWLGGLPSQLHAQVRTRLHEIEVEDEAFALLEYANGAHGYLYASTTEVPDENVIEICGDRGKLKITNGRVECRQLDYSIREFTSTSEEMWGGIKATPVDLAIETPPEDAPRAHSAIIQNFCRSILYNEPLLAPGEEGLNAMEVINGVILSGKLGKPVPLPVDRREYDTLLEKLKAESKPKTRVWEQNVTDPKF